MAEKAKKIELCLVVQARQYGDDEFYTSALAFHSRCNAKEYVQKELRKAVTEMVNDETNVELPKWEFDECFDEATCNDGYTFMKWTIDDASFED